MRNAATERSCHLLCMIASPSPGAIRPTARDNAKAALRISEGFNMESKHNRLIGYLVYDAQKRSPFHKEY